MTIKETLKKGMVIDCEIKLHRYGEAEVFFFNTADNREDSTTFDIEYPLGKKGEAELTSLFKDFCKENGIPTNTVEGLQLNCVAETYEELTAIC